MKQIREEREKERASSVTRWSKHVIFEVWNRRGSWINKIARYRSSRRDYAVA